MGGTTYGGTGVYGAQIGGLWDALLGEGRFFWFFASSDWHNRGSFGPDDRSSSAVEALAVNAALDNTDVSHRDCATMGENLEAKPGEDIVVAIVVRDPSGTNYSPYTFNNPSLAQVGIQQPLNAPQLDHIDVIRGMVTGYKAPGAADYSGQSPSDWIVPYLNGSAPSLASVPAAAKNTTAAVIKTFNDATRDTVKRNPEFKVMTFRIRDVKASQYVRLRGTNLPPSVPFETAADASLCRKPGGVGPLSGFVVAAGRHHDRQHPGYDGWTCSPRDRAAHAITSRS